MLVEDDMNVNYQDEANTLKTHSMKDEPNSQKGGTVPLSEENANQGRWTDEEHEKFLEALKIYGKNWNKVHRHVGTRTSAQTRSHAQKYFNKLMKKGSKEANQESLKREDSHHSVSNKGTNFKQDLSYHGREISIEDLLPIIKTGGLIEELEKMAPGENQGGAYGNLN